jgi:serine O-acetyltransferase
VSFDARTLGRVLRQAFYSPLLQLPQGRARERIGADVARWHTAVGLDVAPRRALLALLAAYPEFRTLFYYRLRRAGGAPALAAAVAAWMYPGERTLHLACADIGPGLFIQHGFATIVAARRVGANCWINQQVTVGFSRPDARPTIGDNVAIYAGAKVLGEVTVGDGAVIGANAVVLQDVPPGGTAVGVPARILPPKPADGSGGAQPGAPEPSP